MKQIIGILFFAAGLFGQTRATVNQLGGPGTGDTRVLIQQDNGIWVMARIDAATLEVVPAAVPNQPPVLRAKVPPPAPSASWELWLPAKATAAQQVWTVPETFSRALVFRNGVLQRVSEDYDVSGTTGTVLTFRNNVVQSGDIVTVLYQR